MNYLHCHSSRHNLLTDTDSPSVSSVFVWVGFTPTFGSITGSQWRGNDNLWEAQQHGRQLHKLTCTTSSPSSAELGHTVQGATTTYKGKVGQSLSIKKVWGEKVDCSIPMCRSKVHVAPRVLSKVCEILAHQWPKAWPQTIILVNSVNFVPPDWVNNSPVTAFCSLWVRKLQIPRQWCWRERWFGFAHWQVI